MAIRPLSFRARYTAGGRTVRVRADERDPRRYLLEVLRRGEKTRRTERVSLAIALRHFATAWRQRLH